MIRRLALIILAALTLAAPAAGSQALTPQQVSDATAAFLTDALHHQVDARQVVVTADLQAETVLRLPRGAVLGEYRHGTTIYLRPWVGRAVGDPARWERLAAAAVLRHELLHRPLCNRDGLGFDSGVAAKVEEGLAEAVNRDVAPAWERIFAPSIRQRHADSLELETYEDEVAMVRAASMAATGARTWRARSAREWRKDVLFLPCEARAAAWPTTPTRKAPR